MRERRRKVTIYLKSGARIKIRVSKFELSYNRFGEVTELNWSGWWWSNKTLSNVLLSQIDAVVYSRW